MRRLLSFMGYQTADANSTHTQLAEQELQRRLDIGLESAQKLIDSISSRIIVDRQYLPGDLTFTTVNGRQAVLYPNEPDKPYLLHGHALAQLCSKMRIPMNYARPLEEGEEYEKTLLTHSMNELIPRIPTKSAKGVDLRYLHRLVGDELWGFLSTRFARHISSQPNLAAFIEGCNEVSARPLEALDRGIRVGVKAYLPYVFEPAPGEFVALGASWYNSDFGCGRMQVSLTSLRIFSGTTTILEDTLSKVHIGAVIGDTDVELPTEAIVAEINAQAEAVKGAVQTMLSPESINKVVHALELATEEEMSWTKLRGQLRAYLLKAELQELERLAKSSTDAYNLPPINKDAEGNPLPTKWWAANALSWVSQRVDPSRQEELESAAGGLLRA